MRRSSLILSFLALTASVSACDTAGRHLYMVHNTVVGIDAAVNTDPPRGHLLVGYDRQFGAWIPRSVPETSDEAGGATPQQRDAMTAIACSKIGVDGIFLSQFTEYLATGRAAELYAKALKSHAGTELYECLNKSANPE